MHTATATVTPACSNRGDTVIIVRQNQRGHYYVSLIASLIEESLCPINLSYASFMGLVINSATEKIIQ